MVEAALDLVAGGVLCVVRHRTAGAATPSAESVAVQDAQQNQQTEDTAELAVHEAVAVVAHHSSHISGSHVLHSYTSWFFCRLVGIYQQSLRAHDR